MDALFVGVCKASLLIRHARSAKDRRQVVQSLVQKLRNLDFTVTESGSTSNPKIASIGFACVGGNEGGVKARVEQAWTFFVGDYYVAQRDEHIFEFNDYLDPDADWSDSDPEIDKY